LSGLNQAGKFARRKSGRPEFEQKETKSAKGKKIGWLPSLPSLPFVRMKWSWQADAVQGYQPFNLANVQAAFINPSRADWDKPSGRNRVAVEKLVAR
jgi:hypothetical protein